MISNPKKWIFCAACQGRGKKSKGLSDKAKRAYTNALQQFEKESRKGPMPQPPKAHLHSCITCHGTGIVEGTAFLTPDFNNFPTVAIIGGGIGGVALAVACLHRGIPFTLYERDINFHARSQGYGLTLQQASKAISSLGIENLSQGIKSSRHVVHNTDGQIIGEWGARKWLTEDAKNSGKRSNIHIARQALRSTLLEQLQDHQAIQWNHQLIGFKDTADAGIELRFEVDDQIITKTAHLVVGADGIRSTVRKLLLGDQIAPLRYLNCIVILGICSLKDNPSIQDSLLDNATVFQTANGNERIYMMPYDNDSIMWQFSFPLAETEAILLSAKGPAALKTEALARMQWHHPIPAIIAATPENLISGYPVYDRALLQTSDLHHDKITLLGDAAHPMSPFKGQGANQALLDAVALAQAIHSGCRGNKSWREIGLRQAVLQKYESEMLKRSAVKVEDSAAAAKFLHSDVVLMEADSPRGRIFKKK